MHQFILDFFILCYLFVTLELSAILKEHLLFNVADSPVFPGRSLRPLPLPFYTK